MVISFFSVEVLMLFENIIHFDLLKLVLKLLLKNQSSIKVISDSALFQANGQIVSEIISAVSSAYRSIFYLPLICTMYIVHYIKNWRKNHTLRDALLNPTYAIECGSYSLTCWNLSCKYDLKIEYAFPIIPKEYNCFNRTLCDILSKALLRFKNMPIDFLCLSRLL